MWHNFSASPQPLKACNLLLLKYEFKRTSAQLQQHSISQICTTFEAKPCGMSSVPGRSHALYFNSHPIPRPKKTGFRFKMQNFAKKSWEPGCQPITISVSVHTNTHTSGSSGTHLQQHTYSHTYNDMHVRWWWTTFDLFRFQGWKHRDKVSKLTHFNFIKHYHHTVAASYDQPVSRRKRGCTHTHTDTGCLWEIYLLLHEFCGAVVLRCVLWDTVCKCVILGLGGH